MNARERLVGEVSLAGWKNARCGDLPTSRSLAGSHSLSHPNEYPRAASWEDAAHWDCEDDLCIT